MGTQKPLASLRDERGTPRYHSYLFYTNTLMANTGKTLDRINKKPSTQKSRKVIKYHSIASDTGNSTDILLS